MKTFILGLLFSMSTLAADYTCRANWVSLELKTNGNMTMLTVKDVQTGEFYYNGFVHEVIERQGLTDLMFETRQHNFLQLQFKTSDLKNEASKLFGFARGWYGGGFVDNSILCNKANSPI